MAIVAQSSKFGTYGRPILACAVGLLFFFPIFYMVMTSFKTDADAVKPDRAIDMSSENLEDIVAAETNGIGPSVIITAAPSGQAQEQAIAMAAPGGRVSFFGGLPKDKPMIQVDSNVVHYKELILAGANGSSPAQNKEALALIASGAVPVADLITHRLPLDQVQDAISAVTSGEANKVVIKPPGV